MFTFIKRSILLFLTVLVISCQKELSVEIGKGGVPIVSASLKMKIDGSQWTANKQAGASILAGFININGVSIDGKSLSITLDDNVTGTYVLDKQSFNSATFSDSLDLGGLPFTSSDGRDTSQAGGVVIVTNIDNINNTISGTFRFKAFRAFDSKQKQITEGAFDKLPFVSTLPPANTTDTFRVTIDNSNWTAKSITGTVSGPNIFITGSELDLSKLVALSIPSNVARGTYNLDAITGTYVGIYSPGPNNIMPSLSGKITIIEHNTVSKRIRGDFTFLATDGTAKSYLLTAGYFSVIYQ